MQFLLNFVGQTLVTTEVLRCLFGFSNFRTHRLLCHPKLHKTSVQRQIPPLPRSLFNREQCKRVAENRYPASAVKQCKWGCIITGCISECTGFPKCTDPLAGGGLKLEFYDPCFAAFLLTLITLQSVFISVRSSIRVIEPLGNMEHDLEFGYTWLLLACV